MLQCGHFLHESTGDRLKICAGHIARLWAIEREIWFAWFHFGQELQSQSWHTQTHKHASHHSKLKKENGPYQHDLRTISFKVVLWRKSFKHNWQRYCSSRRQKWPIHGWGHKNFLWRLLTCPLSQEFINQYVGLFKSAKTLSESCEHFANVIYRQKAGADKEHQMQKRKVRQDSQPPNLSQLSKSRKENALQNWRDVGYNWIPSVLVRRHCKKAIKFWRKVT